MEQLDLPPYEDFTHKKTPKQEATKTITPAAAGVVSEVTSNTEKPSRWFNPDSIENLTNKECVIRGGCVILLPMTAAIDWTYHTYTMAFIIPIIFYLEFTAFTMYCPVKRLFSNYSHPTKVE